MFAGFRVGAAIETTRLPARFSKACHAHCRMSAEKMNYHSILLNTEIHIINNPIFISIFEFSTKFYVILDVFEISDLHAKLSSVHTHII